MRSESAALKERADYTSASAKIQYFFIYARKKTSAQCTTTKAGKFEEEKIGKLWYTTSMSDAQIPYQAIEDFNRQITEVEEELLSIDPADASRVHGEISAARNALFDQLDDVDLHWEEPGASSEAARLGQPLKQRCKEILVELAQIQIRQSVAESLENEEETETPVRSIPEIEFSSFKAWDSAIWNRYSVLYDSFRLRGNNSVNTKLEAVQNFIAVLFAYNSEWEVSDPEIQSRTSRIRYISLLEDATIISKSADRSEWLDFGTRVSKIEFF